MNKMLLLMLALAVSIGIFAYIGYYSPMKTEPVSLLANGTASVMDSTSDSLNRITNSVQKWDNDTFH
jgi:hypothetical protein